MNIADWLKYAEVRLEKTGIGTARLDALVLLEDATGKDRAYLLAHPEKVVTGSTYHKLEKHIQRRAEHEPLAYIRGKTEFYGREFIINKDVLEPRPESETMVELLLDLAKSQKLKAKSIIDIGTGSGALAITAKLEVPEAQVLATDIDPKCLKVARQNAKKFGVDIKLLQGDLLEPLLAVSRQLSAVVANLPYVPDNYKINQAALNEPAHAMFGGKDGLDLYRRLFDQLNRGEVRVQYVLTESLPFQHKALAKIAKNANYKLQKTDDFIQLFRAKG